MDIATMFATGKTVIEVGGEINNILTKARDNRHLTQKVLLYLDALKESIRALGLERQYILQDVRHCHIRDPQQVDAVTKRMSNYLYVDNISSRLRESLKGLNESRDSIQNQASGIRWRKRDKQEAVRQFLVTLDELEMLLQNLTNNFYPNGSGMGIQTLFPIYEELNQINEAHKDGSSAELDFSALQERLGELLTTAVQDESQTTWFNTTGKLEALIMQLQIAFMVSADG